ncbi:MAG TPA: addiction module protein [Gemmataceae bacterium]
MSEKAEKLKAALAELSLEEREDIRVYLDSLEGEGLTQEEWEKSWSEEINSRIADINSGKVQLIPWEDVRREMREKFG